MVIGSWIMVFGGCSYNMEILRNHLGRLRVSHGPSWPRGFGQPPRKLRNQETSKCGKVAAASPQSHMGCI